MCMFVFKCTHCGGQRTALGVDLQLSSCLKQFLFVLLHMSKSPWASGDSVSISHLAVQTLETKMHATYCMQYYVGSWDLNSGPQAHTGSTFSHRVTF